MKPIWFVTAVARRGASALPFTDMFNRETVGSGWSAGAISGEALVITPTYDASMMKAGKGTYESGVDTWAAAGSNTVTNDAGEVKIVFVNNDGGGILSIGNTTDFTSNMTAARAYLLTLDARYSGGASTPYLPGTPNFLMAPVNTLTSSPYRVYFYAMSGTRNLTLTGFAAGETLWIDNLVLRPVVTASMYAAAAPTWTGDGFVRAMITPASNKGWVGVFMSMNDTASPTSWVELLISAAANTGVLLYKMVSGTRTLVASAGVTARSGMLIELRRSGTSYSIYIDGAQVSTTQTISDAAIASGTHHGVVGTEDAAIQAFGMGDMLVTSKRIAYVGGSITLTGYSVNWRTVTRDYAMQQNMDWAIGVNSVYGNSFTPLVHLFRMSEIIASTPTLVVIDLCANGDTGDASQSASEALIRLLRTNLPNATLMFILFPTWNVGTATSPYNQTLINLYKTMCDTYDVDYIDVAAQMTTTLAGAAVSTSGWYTSPDWTHPDQEGNDFIGAYADDFFTRTRLAGSGASQWTGNLADYTAINANYTRYAGTLTQRNATSNDGESNSGGGGGSWSTVSTTYRASSTAGDRIQWTATSTAAGLNFTGQSGTGTFKYRIDGGAWSSNVVGTSQANTNQFIMLADNIAAASHTYEIEVVSGTVTLRQFFAL